jgi:hypothetical protein
MGDSKQYFDSWERFDADAAEAAVDVASSSDDEAFEVLEETLHHPQAQALKEAAEREKKEKKRAEVERKVAAARAKQQQQQQQQQQQPAVREGDGGLGGGDGQSFGGQSSARIEEVARSMGVDAQMVHACAHAMSLTSEQVARMPAEARSKVEAVRDGAPFREMRAAVESLGLATPEAQAMLRSASPSSVSGAAEMDTDMLKAVAQALSLTEAEVGAMPPAEQEAVKAVREDPRFDDVRKQVLGRLQATSEEGSLDVDALHKRYGNGRAGAAGGGGSGSGGSGSNAPAAAAPPVAAAEPEELDILSMMDFGFIDECADAPVLHGVLAALRSGEHGEYPDLVAHCGARIAELEASQPPKQNKNKPRKSKAAQVQPPPPPPAFARGAAVELHGLVSKPELNGTRGVVVAGPARATGRYSVRCATDGKDRALKEQNLRGAPPAPPPPAAEKEEKEKEEEEEEEGGGELQVQVVVGADGLEGGEGMDEGSMTRISIQLGSSSSSSSDEDAEDALERGDGGEDWVTVKSPTREAKRARDRAQAEAEAARAKAEEQVAAKEAEAAAAAKAAAQAKAKAATGEVTIDVKRIDADDDGAPCAPALKAVLRLPFLSSMKGVALSCAGRTLALAPEGRSELTFELPSEIDDEAPIRAHFSKKLRVLTLTLVCAAAGGEQQVWQLQQPAAVAEEEILEFEGGLRGGDGCGGSAVADSGDQPGGDDAAADSDDMSDDDELDLD